MAEAVLTPARRRGPNDHMTDTKEVNAKIRMTAKERAAFGMAAQAVGLSFASWVRLTLHTAAQPQISALSKRRPK
jgi:hypothetical protein